MPLAAFAPASFPATHANVASSSAASAFGVGAVPPNGAPFGPLGAPGPTGAAGPFAAPPQQPSALSPGSIETPIDVAFRRKRSWSPYVVAVLLVLIAIVGYFLLQDH